MLLEALPYYAFCSGFANAKNINIRPSDHAQLLLLRRCSSSLIVKETKFFSPSLSTKEIEYLCAFLS